MNIFDTLRQHLESEIQNNDLDLEMVTIESKYLTAHEAIGETERKDFPIIIGKEIMLEADFKGAKGQAFTSSPAIFKGSLRDVLDMDLESNPYERSLFIATLNAVMRYLNKADRTIHCRNGEPERCAKNFPTFIKDNFEGKIKDPKVAIVGYQPAIIDVMKDFYNIRVLDLNPDIVGTERYTLNIEDGIKDYNSVVKWADIIVCTGSTLCNGSIVDFMNLDKPVYFYGTTIAAAAEILKVERLCFCSK